MIAKALNCLVVIGILMSFGPWGVVGAPLTYDKNTILCDHDFAFTNSLSEAEIQAIFGSHNSFFKDYVDPVTSQRASWIIADRAQHYQISSRVLLAKMQAESSSVWAYRDMNEHIDNKAGIDMGTRAEWVLFYGWSDTTIYPQYKGFYSQVDNAAKSLSEWFSNPSSKGWTVGQPHLVSDGTVTPTNQATAALYIYTPWISSNELLYNVWKMMFGDTGECSVIAYTFRLPLEGEWSPSQDFGAWNSAYCGYHLAEDVIRDSEVPVYAAADGTVKLAKLKGGYGYVVIIQHKLPPGDPDGDYVCTLYGHLRKEGLVAPGASVSKGDIIGNLSSKPEYNGGVIHLHFGIRKDQYLGEVNDPKTGHWYYAGYTKIYDQCNKDNPIHQQILAEWFNPTDPINGEGFIERHQFFPPSLCCRPAVYTWYYFDKVSKFSDLSIYLKPQEIPLNIYAALQFWFEAHHEEDESKSNVGGYIGIQRLEEKEKKIAIFSLWDIWDVDKHPDKPHTTEPKLPNCEYFGGEGTGVSCKIEYNWEIGKEYKLYIEKVESTDEGEIWEGTIYDENNNKQVIGRILLKNTQKYNGYGLLKDGLVTWIEYFGYSANPSCEVYPLSKVTWRGPYTNSFIAIKAIPNYGSVSPGCNLLNPYSNVFSTLYPHVTQEAGDKVKRSDNENKNIWEGLIIALDILSPTQASPANAGDYNNPSHIEVTVEAKKGDTPLTGLTKDEFAFKIGGKEATASIIDTSIPGRYVFDVTPPEQDNPGKYDLEVILKYKGITITDKEKEAVIYTKGRADVMLIIDRSGSMRWPSSKIADAKTSAKLFVDYMRDGDKTGVASFASSARYDYHLITLTGAVKNAIKNAIDGIYASGGTAMGRGLRYGYNDFINRGDPTHAWAMVLLSDGYHNRGEHPNNVLPSIKSQDIIVYTIGLGPSVDKNLLEHIATETGGKYYYTPSSDKLKEIYESIVGKVIGWQTILKRVFTIILNQIIHILVPIDPSVSEATFSISWGGSDLDLVLYKPDATKIDPSVAVTDPNIDYVEEATYEFYRVRNPDPGAWKMEVIAISVPPGGEEFTATVTGASTLSMSLSTDKDQYNQGEAVKTTVSLTEDGSPIVGANVMADVSLPDNSIESLILYDDGGHGDGAANDGVYANYFVNTLQIGDYEVEATATGTTLTGNPFSRESDTSFKIIQGPSRITFTPDTWDETANAGVQVKNAFTVVDPSEVGEQFPVNEYLYAEYNGTHYLVYNESSIGGEPDYIISSNPGSNPQVSKWVSLTATSLQTPTGDIIDASNVIISPNVLEVPLGGSEDFDVSIQIPSDAVGGTYTGKIVASAITGSDSIDITLTVEEAVDTTPPTIESVTLDAYTTIPDATIHVTVEATDNVGVASGTADGVNLVETGSIWEGDITAPSTTGDYTLTIRAEDAAENYAETTVDYSVVKPSGSIGIGVDPRLTTVSAGDTALINIKLVSTENFDDIAHVYLTTEGIYPGYEANLTWFNWTSKYVKVPKGGEVNVPLEVNIPGGESGYKVFYAKLESTKWTPTAMDTGILYII